MKAAATAKETYLTLKEKLDALEESITDKKEDITNLENATKKLEAEYKKEKEARFFIGLILVAMCGSIEAEQCKSRSFEQGNCTTQGELCISFEPKRPKS